MLLAIIFTIFKINSLKIQYALHNSVNGIPGCNKNRRPQTKLM